MLFVSKLTIIPPFGLQNIAIFKKTGYFALPCVVLLVDGVVKFAGSGSKFEGHLEETLNELHPNEA